MPKSVRNEKLIYTNMMQLEGIIRLLDKKKIISSLEILEEVEKLESEMQNKIKKKRS